MMHCDVKSLNFLVSSDFVIKLADLGESRPFRASMPPEESKLMPK
jgi:serine/threonine protein kinase